MIPGSICSVPQGGRFADISLGIPDGLQEFGCLVSFVQFSETTTRVQFHADEASATDCCWPTSTAFPEPDLGFLQGHRSGYYVGIFGAQGGFAAVDFIESNMTHVRAATEHVRTLIVGAGTTACDYETT